MPFLRLICALALGLLSGQTAAMERVTGTASYRERIAMPPGVVFEAALEDISLADAPAMTIGLVRVEDAGNPPYDFAIDYEPGRIDPTRTYSVSAQLMHDGKLLFVSDTVHPVLTRGAPDNVNIRMVQVQRPAPRAERAGATRPRARPIATAGETPAIGAHGLRLPASFTGRLPCADCPGIDHHLDLWTDQVYHLRREWLGDPPRVRGEAGRWYVDPARSALVLYGASEAPLQFEIAGPDRLRLLDVAGRPIVSDLPYELDSLGRLEPVDIELFLRGEFTYMADAPRFRDCVTGRSYPVAQEGDYLALERAYMDTRTEAGEPIVAVLEGGIAERPGMEEGTRVRAVIVSRFDRLEAGAACTPPDPPVTVDADLTNTYWRIESVGDTALDVQPGRREPHLILRGDGAGYAATVGCNQMRGGYMVDGTALTFQPGAMTLMACPPPLDAAERALTDALSRTAGWRIEGEAMELLDAEGAPIVRLRAVYLP